MWNFKCRLVLIVCMILSYFEKGNCYDYCQVDCKLFGIADKHTMCEYPKAGPSSTCEQYDKAKSSMSETEKEAILDAHNKLRSKVARGEETLGTSPQPEAADMMEVIWDAEVEEIARRWADQCKKGHDRCRKSKDGPMMGQNRAWNSDTAVSDVKHVEGWYNEVKDFDPQDLTFKSNAGGPETGHYTQLVWAATTKIGCAKTVANQEGSVSVVMVCNYLPAGNFLGAKIYTKGKKCSACPNGNKCSEKYDGLCGNPEKSSFFTGTARAGHIRMNSVLMVYVIVSTLLYNCYV